jgi:hypothetical protein
MRARSKKTLYSNFIHVKKNPPGGNGPMARHVDTRLYTICDDFKMHQKLPFSTKNRP